MAEIHWLTGFSRVAELLLGCPLIFAVSESAGERRKTREASPDLKPARHSRIRLGGISAGVGYTHHSVGYWPSPFYRRYAYWPGFWQPGCWGYDPWWWYKAIHPGYFSGFGYAPFMGLEQKAESEDRQL